MSLDTEQKADQPLSAKDLAEQILNEIYALPIRNTTTTTPIRRKYLRGLKSASPAYVLSVTKEISKNPAYRWFAWQLLQNHKSAFSGIGEDELLELGKKIEDWGTADAFARILSGPAWLRDQISDDIIRKWATCEDRWWRRIALVSTVALNVKSQGGFGDARRTLEVCSLLVEDKNDMVIKAMSWALRELVPHEPKKVIEFLNENEKSLSARVKREVRNKLNTGLKNPRQQK